MKNHQLFEYFTTSLPQPTEPFVVLPDSGILKDHSKKTEIQINQQRRQTQKFEFFLNCFDFLTDNEISGDYFEFGCHRARTFRMALSAARFYNLNSMLSILLRDCLI